MRSYLLCVEGLGIGIAIAEVAGQLADAIMVALAAGTFIYVGATEVIAEEFETPHDKWKKFFALTGMHVCVCAVGRLLCDVYMVRFMGSTPYTKDYYIVEKCTSSA